jgi:hypothetical protein
VGQKNAANFDSLGLSYLPGNLFAPHMNMGWCGALHRRAVSGFGRYRLPLPLRYPIIVKSGKDIQPFFINPRQIALGRRWSFDRCWGVSYMQ